MEKTTPLAERRADWWLTGGLPESLDPYGGIIPLQGTFDELA